MADTTGRSRLFGDSLPGTGGDFIDTTDVEGHMDDQTRDQQPIDTDQDVEGHKRNYNLSGNTADDAGEDVEGHKRNYNLSGAKADEDVEGHKRNYNLSGAKADEDVEGHKRNYNLSGAKADEDVEGHKR